ncbi:MAG: hypothetical protein MOB07_23325 [Acidobacteria bacterium]|nr:hypothetical protein [Acidobacteriota bacterium]
MAKGLKRSLKRTQGATTFTRVTVLSAANIIGMFAAPFEIVPAQGANKFIVVESIIFKMIRTATAFTLGGALSFKFAAGATVSPTIAATVVTTGGAGTEYSHLDKLEAALIPVANAGLQITNATAAFATGTGTAEVTVTYNVITA